MLQPESCRVLQAFLLRLSTAKLQKTILREDEAELVCWDCRRHEWQDAGGCRGPLPIGPTRPLSAWQGYLTKWGGVCKLQVRLPTLCLHAP